MKTMNDFSAFKLNKNQMGAMKGGAKYACTAFWTKDDDSCTYEINTDLTREEVRRQVQQQTGAQMVICVEGPA